ncbi:MAG: hypothetical protein JWM93_262, partial [Frankiales bacterium]|nr:hypothetical protein [Frankiales bacterium]
DLRGRRHEKHGHASGYEHRKDRASSKSHTWGRLGKLDRLP